MKKNLLTLALLAIATLVFSSCGSTTETTTTTTTDRTQASTYPR